MFFVPASENFPLIFDGSGFEDFHFSMQNRGLHPKCLIFVFLPVFLIQTYTI